MIIEEFKQLEKNMLSRYFCENISNSEDFKIEDLHALLKYSTQETIKVRNLQYLISKNIIF